MPATILPSSAANGHQSLRGRSQPDCHPIDSITDLRATLEAVVAGNGAPVGNATPEPVSTVDDASPGSALMAARQDHVHAIPLATETVPGVVTVGPGGVMPYREQDASIEETQTALSQHEQETTEAHGGVIARDGNGVAGRLARWTGEASMDAPAGVTYADADPDAWALVGYADVDAYGNVAPFPGGPHAAGTYRIDYVSGTMLVWPAAPGGALYIATRQDGSTLIQANAGAGWEAFSLDPDFDTDPAQCVVPATGKTLTRVLGSAMTIQMRLLDSYTADNSGGPVRFALYRHQGTEGRLDVDGQVRFTGQAGTGERLVVAQADGTQRDVDEVTWDANGLKVTINTNTWIGYRVKNNGAGTAAAASLSFENNSGVQSYVESYGSGNTPAIAGIARANAAAFMGGGSPLSAVFYGLDDSVSAVAPVCFVWKANEEGRFTSDGWTFRQRIQVTADAGSGERMIVAQADGHHRDVDDVQWEADAGTAYRRLLVTSGINGFVGTNTIATGTGSGAVAAHQAVGASGEYAIQAAWCTGNAQTVGGISAANGIGFVGYGTNTVFYGSHASGNGATVYFAYDVGISARYDLSGWTFRDRITVTADAGTGQRLMSVDADGHHLPIAEATWAGGVLTLNGKLVLPPSVAGSAYLNLGDGALPTTLVNGDIWISGSYLRFRSAGSTFTLVPESRLVSTQWSLTGGGSLGSNRTLNLVNDLAVPPTDADYGTDSMRRRGWYKGNESLPRPAPFSPCVSSFGTFPTGPIAVPALNPQAAFAAFALGA